MAILLPEIDFYTLQSLGITPYNALYSSYQRSLYAKSAFIDGKLVAMWGLAGTYLGPAGYPWLALAPSVEKYPFKVVFRYRQELKEMLQLFPVLIEDVDVRNVKSVRLLKLMGFIMSEPKPIGKNGELFMRAEKR